MNDLVTQFEEVRLVYRNKTLASERPKVNCASTAYEIFLKSWDKDQIQLFEECKILLLDNHFRMMSIANISRGSMSETLVDPRAIFAIALKRRANCIIMAHNHPSGVLKPSRADIELTKRLSSLGEMMRIPLEDHLIISPNGFSSIIHDDLRSLEPC
ncbi:MAG: JAB domain-containing protein [Cyclobacteriaceae bacterium]